MAKDKKVLAVIPARLQSTRLERKALQHIGEKTLVQRVWERAKSATTLDRVVVATDSDEIFDEVLRFGGEVLMTDSSITTGTQRVAVALSLLGESSWDVVVNVQGDMPFIRGELIDRVVEFFIESENRFDMATAATPIFDEQTFLSPADVKVVVGERGDAFYFSRSPVPHSRDGALLEFDIKQKHYVDILGLKHFGLYVFKPAVLKVFCTEEFSRLERVEKLEQLRLLDQGYRVGVCVIEPELTQGAVEVDTPEDLERSRDLVRDTPTLTI